MPDPESHNPANGANGTDAADPQLAEFARSLDELGQQFTLLRSGVTSLMQHAAETQAARLNLAVEIAARSGDEGAAELAGLRERAADATAFARAVNAGFPVAAPGPATPGTGGATIEMIDFTNNGYDEAVRLLNEIGHRGEIEIKTVEGRAPGGRIVEQAPRPLARLAADTTVMFIFAVAAEATVPELAGRTRTDATRLLASLGLRARFTGPSRASIVAGQKPDAGTRLARDSEVELAMTGKDR